MSTPLLPLRTAVVLGAALIVAAITGALTYASNKKLPKEALAGGAAFAGAVFWLNDLIAV
ncbi:MULTISPECIES: hypothetical protein [Mycolicibacter]|uniref:ZIP family metal transporter n=2 Tax=Mycolicibacter TaxID=1073531 RepID=A0ABU5XLH5_9MYCO|nr:MULTISPECIES: hypothetical protein [unclassified Mycolicibacter]MEB3023059.1 hypothetical protein [Mycolicibacter sp. MYC098]MEB3033569.1 hypothetical protein [Mycolicibacter sp. MYC340]